ncbi:MAG: hypothetical protein ACI884_002314 [Ulvibacter sp.]|jgi:hypothetical protein
MLHNLNARKTYETGNTSNYLDITTIPFLKWGKSACVMATGEK